MSIPIKSVKTDRFTMDYFSFGNGAQPLVILPGLSVLSVMNAADTIAASYQSVADLFTVYVFDRRADIPSSYTIRDMAQDTEDAFDELGLCNVCLFGASQGGMIAIVMASERPDLVSRMVLGSTTANVTDTHFQTIERWIRLAESGDAAGLYIDFGKSIYPPSVFKEYRDALLEMSKAVTVSELKRFITLAEGTRGFNAVDALDSITCPVLAVGAFDDAVLDPDSTMEIAVNLDYRPDFRLYMYVGYGHAAFDTAPDFHQRILEFFLG